MSEKKEFPPAVCQFCQQPVEQPGSFWDLYSCNNCGAQYSMEFPEDIADIVLNAEEDGGEVKVLRNYDFSKASKDEPDEYGVWVHLVFRRKANYS
ncbi:MAG: hypothetical protein HYU83_02735 [Chloroflexi bacterium]|nr:hypothetical protein [Chloroflexota bacterium]